MGTRRTALRVVMAALPLLVVAVPARAALLWDGSASKGAGVFLGVECVNGMVTVVQDPSYGAVWKIFFPNGDERCEVRGSNGYEIKNDGSEIFVGWRSRYDVADGTLRYVFQMKGYPAAGMGLQSNHPVVFATEHTNLVLINYAIGDTRHDVWQSTISRTDWVSIVLHMKVSSDPAVGFIELWWNGAKQQLTNGSDRYPANTFDGGQTLVKWGVYRGGQGPGDCTQYLDDPKIGSTYDDVAPTGSIVVDAGVTDGPIPVPIDSDAAVAGDSPSGPAVADVAAPAALEASTPESPRDSSATPPLPPSTGQPSGCGTGGGRRPGPLGGSACVAFLLLARRARRRPIAG